MDKVQSTRYVLEVVREELTTQAEEGEKGKGSEPNTEEMSID